MANNADKHLADLLSKPGFDEIARLSKNRHWFTYLPRLCYEQQRQACLLWLLTPIEGHDQGDYFIKRLLSAAFAQAEEKNIPIPISGSSDSDNGLNEPESRLFLLTKSYGSAVAAQEVQFKDHDDSCRYIDLLVVDADNKIVILIERKDGTSEQNDQLTSYLNYVKYHCGSSYSIFPILIDSHNADHNASAKGYVQLDDSWLIEAIDEILNHNELEPSVRWNLSTLCNYVFSEYWDATRESYYQGTNKKFNEFAGENADLLQDLFQLPCKHEGPSGDPITVNEANYHDLVWALMSRSGKVQGAKPASIHCHAQYFYTLWELSTYSGLTPVADTISGLSDDMYAHVYFYRNTPILEATCKYGWNSLGGYSPEDDIYWPFYIIVSARDDLIDDGSTTPERMKIRGRKYILSAGASRGCPSELRSLAEKFATRVNSEQWLGGFRPFEDRNWTTRKTKRTEEVTNFTLDSHTALYMRIEEFRRHVYNAVDGT